MYYFFCVLGVAVVILLVIIIDGLRTIEYNQRRLIELIEEKTWIPH